MKRKKFIQLSLALTGVNSLLLSCADRKKIKGQIVGASASVGHLLRDKKLTAPVETIEKNIVVVGAGVSGLSAARHLYQQGITDFVVLDLEQKAGGNAAYGTNQVSSFPLGAHYIPTPNNDLPEYLSFLQECNVITGMTNTGQPVYNELYLCFDPQERLYINGRWQDGLVPHFGVPDDQLKQIEQFLQLMSEFRYRKGLDGKDAFAIPVDRSSNDEEFTRLDTVTMKEWMTRQGFTSSYLHEYVNYCCRDDFGTAHHIASAWSGIHYFASRKGTGSNAAHGDLLTWPEGNGFLINHLKKSIGEQLLTNSLAMKVEATPSGVAIDYLDVASNQVKRFNAQQCILAVPQFIAARLLNDDPRKELVKQHLHYAPWMVANLLTGKLTERSGAPLSWDNVIHESKALGYVDATHELLQQHTPKKNLTYYLPLTERTPDEERMSAHQKTHEEWVEMIIADLQKVHPDIRELTEEVTIMVWGHAMAQPVPGLIHGSIRKQLAMSIQNKIHFAHTDLASISIFEEGFYQGIKAADLVLNNPKTTI